MKTGVSGAIALISSSVGPRRSANWNSFQPPTTRTHWGAGVRATCLRSMSSASASDGTPSQRNSMLKFSPPRITCRWESLSPGMTVRPLRSTCRVLSIRVTHDRIARPRRDDAAVRDGERVGK